MLCCYCCCCRCCYIMYTLKTNLTYMLMWGSMLILLLLLPYTTCIGLLPYSNTIPPPTDDTNLISTTMQLHWGTDITTECLSMDIRNECESFMQLENCTVITGYLIISLIPRPDNGSCDFTIYQFPRLREITDYVIFYGVRYLTHIRDMFPNLTVIRGQHLFVNYALSVVNMGDLRTLEFRSLIAIQRGHVFISRNPKLCNLEKINWNRLTLTKGDNIIYPEHTEQCLTPSKCTGCESTYCWSNKVCQKFENDNVLNLLQGTRRCHSLCLGGCLNSTPDTCMVCKKWRDHGTCVEQCAKDKYISDDYLRCYTKEECIGPKKLYIYKNKCVRFCPVGYKNNNETKECELCSDSETCIKICNPPKEDDPFWIYSLGDVDDLRSCQIYNGSVSIFIHNEIEEKSLIDGFARMTDIKGYLKIYKSPHLTNLNFLKNIRKIHGQIMENEQHSLIVYDNKNLQGLWPLQENFELVHGGIYIHSNDKLCNHLIRDFVSKVKHDPNNDSLQTSELEVLCAPSKLHLLMQILSHTSMKFIWPKEQIYDYVELMYRPMPDGNAFNEGIELNRSICERIKWRRIIKFPNDLSQNGSHYFYTVTDLQAFTKYACLIKTFREEDNYEVRSELFHIVTQKNIPKPPNIESKHTTENSIAIQLNNNNNSNADKVVDYYLLEVYDLPDEKMIIDQRDYCKEPFKLYSDVASYEEDYDDCCMRQQEENEDEWFQQTMKESYTCSRDRTQYCTNEEVENDEKPTLVIRLSSNETFYTLKFLQSFRLYVIQVKACNDFGCSSFAILTQRTKPSTIRNDLFNLTGCHVPHMNEYRIGFNEPPDPNNLIISYIIHLRCNMTFSQCNQTFVHCLTRLQHEQNQYLFKIVLNNNYQQVAVQVNSLSGHIFIGWTDLTICNDPVVFLAGESSKRWNIFLVCFLLGAGGTVLFICYKQHCWRHVFELKRYMHTCRMKVCNFLRHTETLLSDDRRILFDTVQFHTLPEDDTIRLVH